MDHIDTRISNLKILSGALHKKVAEHHITMLLILGEFAEYTDRKTRYKVIVGDKKLITYLKRLTGILSYNTIILQFTITLWKPFGTFIPIVPEQ